MMKAKKLLVLFFVTILVLTSAFSHVNAIDLTPTTGSLTIQKYETGNKNADGEKVKLPLAGVTFRIYKVDDDETSLDTPEGEPTAETITGENGKAEFKNLELGRYLVVEYEKPANVVDVVPNFMVDIPMTIAEGKNLEYNPTVEVKNNTAYGSITLKKVNKNGDALAGVTFILQKKDGTEWKTYEIENKVLTTGERGELTVDGLPIGDYRFIETSTLEGYILDNETAYEFKVSAGEISTDGTSTTTVIPSSITVENEKPTIKKEITGISKDAKNNNSVKDGTNSADIGDIISYKVVVDVPSMIDRLKTFTISDKMDEGLTFLDGSFSVDGTMRLLSQSGQESINTRASNNNEITSEDYVLTSDDHSWSLEFTEHGKEKLMMYESLEITYNAKMNGNAVVTGNGNKVGLKYSNIVKTDSEEIEDAKTESEVSVYTGGLKIEKRALTKDGELLSGAVFKIADSMENARQGKYITNSEGNQITLTTENGLASYKGLSYGTYYLVEVQAPTYEESGEIKYYNLLKDPVKITVNADTFEGVATIIINKKGTLLPMTGGMGALLITVAGIVLVVTGVVYFRKNKEESSKKAK